SGSNPYLSPTTSLQEASGSSRMLTWQHFLLGVDPTTGAPFNVESGANSVAVINPWDVDNDGDGLPDSVWLDVGFPVRTTLDGRKYTPVVAILVIDLDGRLNVNAHGTNEQLNATHMQLIQNSPFAGPNAVNPLTLPRGIGFGPAEIDLTIGLNMAVAQNLLQ